MPGTLLLASLGRWRGTARPIGTMIVCESAQPKRRPGSDTSPRTVPTLRRRRQARITAFAVHDMTGRLIYQGRSVYCSSTPASLAGSGRMSPTGPTLKIQHLSNSGPTSNVITATAAAGYRWRWSCSIRGAAMSPSVIRLPSKLPSNRAQRWPLTSRHARLVSSFGPPPQRPRRTFRHDASKRGGSAKTTAPRRDHTRDT